ncbi:MAG: hypothetical protein NVS3B23_08760 [Candidatus Saccharimonadales bacterium]
MPSKIPHVSSVPHIYLDIDGVLLANEYHKARYADEFIRYCVQNYPTFWLTTHCHGDADEALQRLSLVFDQPMLNIMKAIQATDWNTAKTEAIDFSHPFLWFDDDLYADERADLLKHNRLSSWVEVDLAKNETQLRDLVRDFAKILTLLQ